MGSLTPNYELYKPDPGETGWGGEDKVNGNFDTIDTELKNNKDTAEGHASRHEDGGADALTGANIEGIVRAALAALTANPAFNSKRLTSVSDPTSAQDAATKNYVDGQVVDVDVQVFTSSDTWTKPSGVSAVSVVAVGGGGGGGSGGRGNPAGGAGGGGGGAWTSQVLPASVCGATEAVSVGTGGTGGAAKTGSGDGNPGTAGGSSSFGSLVRAGGGGAGPGGDNDHHVLGGAGGTGQITGGTGGTGCDESAGLAGETSCMGGIYMASL